MVLIYLSPEGNSTITVEKNQYSLQFGMLDKYDNIMYFNVMEKWGEEIKLAWFGV